MTFAEPAGPERPAERAMPVWPERPPMAFAEPAGPERLAERAAGGLNS